MQAAVAKVPNNTAVTKLDGRQVVRHSIATGDGMDTKQGARVIRHVSRPMANRLRVVSLQARNKMASDMRKPVIAGLNVFKGIDRHKEKLKRLGRQISIGRINFITKKNKEIAKFADYATMRYFRPED